jgi:DNA invertase Pin-like site-specific DNA recombinase
LARSSNLKAIGVDLYLDQQSIDTTTPKGKLVFQVSGAFAEFERSIMRHNMYAAAVVAKIEIGAMRRWRWLTI